MTSHKTAQTMKPATAAKKLGVYLPATPAEFQDGVVSRDELDALQAEPPAWLAELRRNGPHPRPVVAARLGVSISGLARGGITEALTTAEIDALKADPPAWLREERVIAEEVRKEQARLRELQKAREKKEQAAAREDAAGAGRSTSRTGSRGGPAPKGRAARSGY
ncbi:MAG TPA: DUF5997 family protein [Yinghuangia sp.]|uniref:DUF5997 family protein n=1 Tax=Yinghuangia sp. YIM S10712 TaxID=3436930 RepID=UPI002CF50F25|nr:DUF5997 family protein [Yinghuangia sp.]